MRRLITAFLLAVVFAACAGPPAGDPTAVSPGLVRRAAYQLRALVRPGPLAKAHAGLDHPRDCASCHDPVRGLTDRRCLDCHTDLAKRMAAKIGPHSAYTGPCRECHDEHRGRAHNQLRDGISSATLKVRLP